MEHVLHIAGHPDQAFWPKTKIEMANVSGADVQGYIEPVLSSKGAPQKLLSEEVNGLAASLDVTSPGNGDAYEPDAFLQAIRRKHDQLMEIKDRLQEQAQEQRVKAARLDEREAAVAFREKRVLAHEKLLGQTAGERTWRGFFSRT